MNYLSRHISRSVRVLIVGILLVVSTQSAAAQLGFLQEIFGKKDVEGDTTLTEPKPTKPLESYFFDDSTRNRLIFAWKIRPGFNEIDSAMVDTLPIRFEVDYQFMLEDVGSAYLGNLGGATRPLNYFRQPQPHNFSFLNAYDAYLYTPERVRYYNVKRPFSHLSWFMSGQTRNAEEQLRLVHAQNITPSTGVNIEYKNRGTRGMYSSQRAKDKNFSFAVNHTGKRYSAHGGYIYNMGDIRENGGVADDRDIVDTLMKPPSTINVRMTDARNRFKWNSFYLNHAYGIPLQRVDDSDFSIAGKSSVFFGHYFEYTQVNKVYSDTRSKTVFTEDDRQKEFYDNWYYNPSETLDSINESIIDNRLFIQLQPFDRDGILGTIDAGIGYATHHYYYFNPEQYLRPSSGVRKSDTYIYGSGQGKFRKYLDWNASLTYFPVGYRSQDLKFEAAIRASAYVRSRPVTLRAEGMIDSRTPSFWTQNYGSNHFIWNNDFSKETETRLAGTLEIPDYGFEAGIWQSVTTDKIYYDTEALPRQKNVSVTGIYAQKNFRFGALNLNHRLLVQKSSNDEVAPVPLLSAYISYFVDFHLVRNVLRLQMGVDGWYNTEYYAPGYMPATMQFYNQREKKLGNYPYMDFFVSAKWKRMRILVKLQHVNHDMFGSRNYFDVLHYPLNRMMFKTGFSWSFYD